MAQVELSDSMGRVAAHMPESTAQLALWDSMGRTAACMPAFNAT